MAKQIITYILLVAGLLSACRSDYLDFEPVSDGSNQELSLTVRASDIVVIDGTVSRADDNGSSTVIAKGERVGLIIFDQDGRLLADNVPYKYDGSKWAFDAGNKEGKQLVYYDATMSDYIVYYPYDASADGVRDEDALKSLSTFAIRKDQSEEDDYRHSDLMIWSYSGKAIKDLPVVLKHVRNSISLDLKLKWWYDDLPSDNTLEYHPLRQAMVDFKVRYENDDAIINVNDSIDYTFRAEDGTLRYILPEGYGGMVTWRYTYRGETFEGGSNVSFLAKGVRYVQDTSADVSYKKMEPLDYYSYKNINGQKYGFVLPWDAAEQFDTYHPIGIVFYVGHHNRDHSDYSQSGINKEKCQGYVLALNDAFLPDQNNPTLPKYTIRWAVEKTVPATSLVTQYTDNLDWSGYDNLVKMREYTGGDKIENDAVFPAAYACETYTGYNGNMGPPSNTSGWFIPTTDMLASVIADSTIDKSFKAIVGFATSDPENNNELFDDNITGYWSSTENSVFPDKAYFRMKSKATSLSTDPKNISKYVRPVLAF